jgi:hypothetical protein
VINQSSHVDQLTSAFHAMLDHGDLEAIVDLFEDSSTLEEPAILSYGGLFRGRDAIRSAMITVMDHWEDLEMVMPRMIDGGKTVVTMLPFNDDDRVSSVRVFYGDTKQVLDALVPA